MVLLPENGRLEETPFPRLLLDLHRASFSGSVHLRRDSVEKDLQFHEGTPVFAESNARSESLATQLLKSGSIDDDAYAQVIDRVERDGCKEERALLDLDLLPSRDLFEALKERVRFRLLDCFDWLEGTIRLVPGDPPPDGVRAFRTDFVPLLHEGVETRWGSERILADLTSKMSHFPKARPESALVTRQLPKDSAVTCVLDGMDGNKPLWQLVELATTPRSLAALWLLDALDVIDYAAAPLDGAISKRTDESEIEIVFETGDEAAKVSEATGESRSKPSDETTASASPAATEHLVADIAAKFARLGEMDHYALLGVDARSDSNTIKRAYLGAAKDYHPDTLARSGVDDEVRSQANRVFAAIGKAYTTLSRAELRREYDAQLAGEDLGADAEQIATAETLYRKGEILLRQGNFRGALEFLLPAVEIYPDEADYQNAAGWALYRKSPPEPESAKGHLEHAASLAPENAEVHFRLGVVLRSLGETELAETCFTRARELDPSVG